MAIMVGKNDEPGAKRRDSRKSLQNDESTIKQWDFRQCPQDELGGCFLYELARESKTILRLANVPVPEGGQERPQEWNRLSYINATCAAILWNLTVDDPSFKVAEMSWFDLSGEQRKKSAAMIGDGLSFHLFPI